MVYDTKYELIGDKLRITNYSVPIANGYRAKRLDYSKDQTNDRSNKSLYRTRCNIKDTIDCNVGQYSKFITLTFKDDLYFEDRKEALKRFNLFTKRFKHHYNEPLRYVAIMELQTGSDRHQSTLESPRMVWHFHLVVFNDLKLDLNDFELNVWQYGITNTKKIDRVENIGLYLMKYITKDTIQFIKNGENMVFKSQGLKKPIISHGIDCKQPIIDVGNKKMVLSYSSNYKYIIPEHTNKTTGELIAGTQYDVVMKEYNLIQEL